VVLCEFCGLQKVHDNIKDNHIKKRTCCRKCAADLVASKESTRAKRKKTIISMFSDVELKKNIIRKRKLTSLERYGTDNPAKSFKIKKKTKDSNISRYGVSSPNSIEAVKRKKIKSYISRYGVSNPSQSDEIKKKKKESSLNQFSRESHTQTHISDESLCVLNNKYTMQYLYDEFNTTDIGTRLGVTDSTIGRYMKMHNISCDKWRFSSSYEIQIQKMLDNIGISHINNDRKIIQPLELDIYIPEKKIAIEMNGVYWHSEESGNKNKKYHLNKTEKCLEQDIQLFHIFDNEWIEKKEIWKSVIKNALGVCDVRMGARQTDIRKVVSSQAKLFCDENHLQGASNSSIRYGLFFKNELVSLMTFSKARFSKADWELQRFCSKKNFLVHGGASKLLKHFRKHHDGSIVSYANKRWSKGNLYEKLGFTFLHDSAPNYFYTKDFKNLESRNKYQKHKLKEVLNKYNNSDSEWTNMKANGYDRIWDSGNKVYLL
jgi:G:T-mismatch repair DNA endonuclease (very short patch repair protein)